MELGPAGPLTSMGERLRRSRRDLGLSTRAVVERLKPRTALSHQTLTNYEKNLTRPPIDVMSALSDLYERPLTWFLSGGACMTGVKYRNLKSKVGVRDRHRFEGECERWLEAYTVIERHLDQPLRATMTFRLGSGEDAAEGAYRLRQELDLGDDDRVESVIDILESLGVRVLETYTELAIDGLAANRGSEHVVVLNARVAHDRARMNAAHELGHLVSGDCDTEGPEGASQEKAAFEFASNLLLTRSMLEEAFARQSVVDMVKFKERFGISLHAMVYRAQQEGLISSGQAKHLWIEFAKRGWKTREPGSVWADRATRFEALIDSALVGQRATLTELALVAGVREDELKRRLAHATGAEAYDAKKENHPAEGHRLRVVG
jgi:Zn-dependent peptidase ImmA (M78 family)